MRKRKEFRVKFYLDSVSPLVLDALDIPTDNAQNLADAGATAPKKLLRSLKRVPAVTSCWLTIKSIMQTQLILCCSKLDMKDAHCLANSLH